MRIDRNLWGEKWSQGNYPSLPCPRCSAPLNFDEDSLVIRTSLYDRYLIEAGCEDEAVSRFSAWLVCAHSKCGEAVAVSGDCEYEYAYGDKGQTLVRHVLLPKAMNPGPPLVSIRDDYPKAVVSPLEESFGLFWLSNEACAGRLRVVLERILDELGFPAQQDPKKYASLDKRIKNWHARFGALNIAKSFMALKWLGNVGSHETSMSRDRILDAYDILSRVLQQLFPPDQRDIDKLVEGIVDTRGRES